MRVWINHHLTAARFALRRLASAPVNTLLAIIAIGIALALPAGGQMLLSNLRQISHHSASKPQISLYMSMDADRTAATNLLSSLAKRAGVKSVELLPREETLKRMRQSPGLKEVIDALPSNPFPDALVISPTDDSPEAMEILAGELRVMPKVDHVQLDSAWVKRIDALLKIGRAGIALLALLLGVGLIAITFNVIRLQVMAMRAEIEVSQLLGATNGYIRRPFLYFGGFLGVFGGLLAWTLVLGTTALIRGPVSELTELYGVPLVLADLGQRDVAILLGGAALLGWLGAALSMRQHIDAPASR